jgi:PTS system fructose-specific IIA component/PTS system nitrogen regulatory IIA component
MKMTDLFSKKAVVLDLEATDRKGALRELVDAAKAAYGLTRLPVADVVDAIVAREKIGSTGLGRGVAIPHTKCEIVKSVVGAFGRSAKGLDFNAVDGEPVYLLFLILATPAKEDEYVEARRCVAKAVLRPHFIKFARNAKNAKDLEVLFAEADEPSAAPGGAR